MLGRPRSLCHSVIVPSFICLKATQNGVSAPEVFALKEVVDNKGVGLHQMTVQRLIAKLEGSLGCLS